MPLMIILLLSVAPLVKTISLACAPMMLATCWVSQKRRMLFNTQEAYHALALLNLLHGLYRRRVRPPNRRHGFSSVGFRIGL